MSFQAPRAPDCSPYRSRTLVTTQHARSKHRIDHQHTAAPARANSQLSQSLDARHRQGYSGTASLTGTLVLPAPLSQLPISFVHANDVIFKVGKSSFSPLHVLNGRVESSFDAREIGGLCLFVQLNFCAARRLKCAVQRCNDLLAIPTPKLCKFVFRRG